MHTRTILILAVLGGLTFAPRCATSPRYDAHAGLSEMGPAGYTPTEAEAAPAVVAVVPPTAVVAEAPAADPFVQTIRPILSARCGECHDPGGRMHAKLPFDDREVVSTNSTAILRRLKGEDRAAMEKWIAGLSAAASQR